MLADLPVFAGTMPRCPPWECGSTARAPCICSTLTSQWSYTCLGLGNLNRLDWPLDHCTFYHINRCTMCGPTTMMCGRALMPAAWPPAHHGPSNPAVDTAIQSWTPAPAVNTPIPLTPKRPADRGENSTEKKRPGMCMCLRGNHCSEDPSIYQQSSP